MNYYIIKGAAYRPAKIFESLEDAQSHVHTYMDQELIWEHNDKYWTSSPTKWGDTVIVQKRTNNENGGI